MQENVIKQLLCFKVLHVLISTYVDINNRCSECQSSHYHGPLRMSKNPALSPTRHPPFS